MLRRTIFIDIDGTIFQYRNSPEEYDAEPILLPGVREAFKRWNSEGASIIITTARKESTREITEKQLRDKHIWYDQLIMGIGNGVRIIINDIKPGTADHPDLMTAQAINLKRDEGLQNVI